MMKVFNFALISVVLSGCLSSVEDEVKINETIVHDDDYHPVYERYTKKMDVIDNFATEQTLTVTYLSDSFIAALSKRYTDIYGVSEPVLADASSKTGFFVSLYSANDKTADLNDSNLWKVILSNTGEQQVPVLIKPLNDKERWSPFFDGVNHWSKEFLVVFDNKLVDPNLDEMVQKNDTKLVFSNADAIVTFQW